MKAFTQVFATVLSIVLISPSAFSQNQFNLGTLNDSQVLLNISATERIEIDQDTLNIALQYVAIGRDRVALQNEVNTVMGTVLEILEDSENVEYSIERYQVYMTSNRDKDADIDQQVWQAQQSLQLKSLDSDAALDLTRRLQEKKLTLQNMYYSLSTVKHESVSDSLMNAALIKLQARADAAAESLSKDDAKLVEVTVNGSGGQNANYRGQTMSMMEMDAGSMNSPVAEPGKTEVSLTVSARAVLSQ